MPRFSRIARSYLLHAGGLDWQKINPDIFGSMIQAVAEDEERGELGLHYTSVPNILKVLNPLFLDDLREQLETAGDNPRKLLNLRKRIARIRVFDPACGSGNFLVIAYIHMREIEAEILERRGEADRRSWIGLENFYGIEIKDFACEVARLSLLIAEFQCDVRLIGQKEAKELVLPLKQTGQIHCGNALRMDWLKVCPPVQAVVEEHDLAGPTGKFALGDTDEPEVETYICGNPPFAGITKQNKAQKDDLKCVFHTTEYSPTSVDYVTAWYHKSEIYTQIQDARIAFVSTNSISQGKSVPKFWKHLLARGLLIRFAYTSFIWKNLAKNNAGVIVVVIGLDRQKKEQRYLFFENERKECDSINAYLNDSRIDMVDERQRPINSLPKLLRGNMPNCGGNLILGLNERNGLIEENTLSHNFIRKYVGSQEISKGIVRYCLLIPDNHLDEALNVPGISERIGKVRECRLDSKKVNTREILSKNPHKFELVSSLGNMPSVAVARTTSESREYLAVDLLSAGTIANDNCFFAAGDESFLLSILVSKLHLIWISTICGRMKNDYRYSNTLGWNTFPVPKLTEQNKIDLTRCAGNILLARETHFPATIAALYDPERMPADLRAAHERNDEVLERIYIGRRFRNDTERLEKLFEMYTKMTEAEKKKPAKAARRGRRGD